MMVAAPPDVKILGPADVGLFRAMLAVFGEAFEATETYAARPPTDAYLKGLLAKPDMIVLVAFAGGEVVGGITAYVLDKYEQERREIYLYDLAVAEAHRRRGHARALIAALQQLACDRGADVVFVQADYGEVPAIALYESIGSREEVLHFDIPVPRLRR